MCVVVAGVVDHALAAVDCQRRFARNHFCDGQHFFQHAVLICEYLIDQTRLFGLLRGHASTGVGEFAHHTFGNEFNQARKGAHVSCHANVDFLNADKRIFGGVAHVAGGDHIDTAADATPLNSGDHG